jgi:hypothetical protein
MTDIRFFPEIGFDKKKHRRNMELLLIAEAEL